MKSIVASLRNSVGLLLIIVVALAPIPLATNRDWAWSPVAAVVGILLLLYGLSRSLDRSEAAALPPSLLTTMAAMSLVFLWALTQAVPWDHASRLADFFSSAETVLGQKLKRDAIDSERAFTGTMRLATYSGVFWLVSQLSRDRRYASALSITLIGSAVLVTLYGLAMEISARSCIVITVVKLQFEHGDPCSFSGTFVNSSNYTDFAAMIGLVCLSKLQDLMLHVSSSSQGARARWRARLTIIIGHGAFYLVAFLILLAGAVYSASRAGVTAFVIAALAMTILNGAMHRERRGSIIGAVLGVLFLVALAVLIGGDGLMRRFLTLLAEGDRERTQLGTLTISAILLKPWAGWGLGSFEPLFSVFQPSALFVTFDKAHNVYLEDAMDLGIPVAGLLILAVAIPGVRCIRGLAQRRRDTQFAAAGVGATILVALHSIVDFGIQIPAIAIVYVAILGTGWAQSWSSRA